MNRKKGAATTLEILIISGLLLFFILMPVAYYNLLISNIAISSVFNAALQSVSVCGGYDSRVERQLYANLMARGMIDSGGLSQVEDVISADKAKPVGQRQVTVDCSSDILSGDMPTYRAYAMGDDSFLNLRIAVRQSGPRNFLAAASSLIGIRHPVSEGYLTLTGSIMSQLPRPV